MLDREATSKGKREVRCSFRCRTRMSIIVTNDRKSSDVEAVREGHVVSRVEEEDEDGCRIKQTRANRELTSCRERSSGCCSVAFISTNHR